MASSQVIDADTHVFESIEQFERRLPAAYAHRAPRIVHDQWAIARILLEGRLYPDPSITAYDAHDALRQQPPSTNDAEADGNGSAQRHGTHLLEGLAMAMQRPGVQDAAARLADLDVEGIDVQVILGSLGLTTCTLRDPAFALAFCRACNDIVAEFCAAYPHRLKAIAAVPLQDVPAAIAEMRRAVEQLGVVGISVPPSLPGKNLDHADFYPFYAEAEAMQVPISLHWGNGAYLPGAGTERFGRHFQNHAIGHPFEQMLAMTALVCGGILERYPRLKFGFLESGCGWVPYWMWRLDEEYHCRHLEVPLMKDSPSGYLTRGNCFFGCSPDEFLIPAVADAVGAETLLFSSDYPHADGSFPTSVATIQRRRDLSATVKAKILGDNAARFYNLTPAARRQAHDDVSKPSGSARGREQTRRAGHVAEPAAR